MTDFTESDAFLQADRSIRHLLTKLNRKGLCGCCTSRALMCSAVYLAEETLGSADAAKMLEAVVVSLRENNKPARFPRGTQH